MTEPIILDETKDQTRRLVQLEATHQIDDEGALSLLYLASLTLDGARLGSISSTGSPTSFWLDATAADAFCVAWTKFRADQEANKQAEEERKQALIAEAYAIAEKYPAITIKETGQSCWRVSCPASGWLTAYPAQGAESLLRDVKSAQDDYQRKLPYIKHMNRDTKATA
ncbi:MAG TPA: hypothetical protein VHL10_03005 [Nitrososphaera sp.]|jgi:hypothetical protein|nr:hypothetical protein [Nitrososphaera sp.]